MLITHRCRCTIARENPKVKGVIDIVDFNATAAGYRIISCKTESYWELINKNKGGRLKYCINEGSDNRKHPANYYI